MILGCEIRGVGGGQDTSKVKRRSFEAPKRRGEDTLCCHQRFFFQRVLEGAQFMVRRVPEGSQGSLPSKDLSLRKIESFIKESNGGQGLGFVLWGTGTVVNRKLLFSAFLMLGCCLELKKS